MTALVKQHKTIELEYLAENADNGREKVVLDSCFDSGNIGRAHFDHKNRNKVRIN